MFKDLNISKQRHGLQESASKNEDPVANVEDEQEGDEIGCASPTIDSRSDSVCDSYLGWILPSMIVLRIPTHERIPASQCLPSSTTCYSPRLLSSLRRIIYLSIPKVGDFTQWVIFAPQRTSGTIWRYFWLS